MAYKLFWDLRSPTGRAKGKIPAGIYVVPKKLICQSPVLYNVVQQC